MTQQRHQSSATLTKATKNGTRQAFLKSTLSSDGELISEDEFEYGEDSSEDSDSEFQISEEDITIGNDSDAELRVMETFEGMDDDDAESVMMSAAIQLSMEFSKNERLTASSNSGAGPSTRKTRSAAAALRAAAAERRLVAPDLRVIDNDISGNPQTDSSEDSEPLANVKGKAKARAKNAKRAAVTLSSSRHPKTSARSAEKRGSNKSRSSRYSNRAEELELRKQLGRKLTHVRTFNRPIAVIAKSWSRLREPLSPYTSIIQVVSTSFRPLDQIYHSFSLTELKTVWGDVEESILVTIPQKDTQPAGLKLGLLPFQLESLHWMKKQEQGIWAGGMLAVSMSSNILGVYFSLTVQYRFRTRWGSLKQICCLYLSS